MLKGFLLTSLLISSFASVANKFSDIDTFTSKCDVGQFECVIKFAKIVISSRQQDKYDEAISRVEKLKQNSTWKDDLLGILYMLKKDNESIKKSEILLLKAHDDGSQSAAQNLAELYFLQDDYINSFKYLDIISNFNHSFPSEKYINWARLYAQHLYMGVPEYKDINKALNLFQRIKELDRSGVAYSYLGYDDVENGRIESGLIHLHKAAEFSNREAILFLGDLYFFGNKLDKDWNKAKELYLNELVQDSGAAHMNLVIIYQMEKNASRMKEHLSKAAKLGNQQARNIYIKLTKNE